MIIQINIFHFLFEKSHPLLRFFGACHQDLGDITTAKVLIQKVQNKNSENFLWINFFEKNIHNINNIKNSN